MRKATVIAGVIASILMLGACEDSDGYDIDIDHPRKSKTIKPGKPKTVKPAAPKFKAPSRRK